MSVFRNEANFMNFANSFRQRKLKLVQIFDTVRTHREGTFTALAYHHNRSLSLSDHLRKMWDRKLNWSPATDAGKKVRGSLR